LRAAGLSFAVGLFQITDRRFIFAEDGSSQQITRQFNIRGDGLRLKKS